MEKEIRESTLAHVMPNLTKGQIRKASKKYGRKFAPKLSDAGASGMGKLLFTKKKKKLWRREKVMKIGRKIIKKRK